MSHVLLDLDRLLLVAGAACGVRVVDLNTVSVVAEVDTEHTSVSGGRGAGGREGVGGRVGPGQRNRWRYGCDNAW